MSKRKQHCQNFNAKVALGAVNGDERISELAIRSWVHPTMIHLWMRALVDGASGVFERGGRKRPLPYPRGGSSWPKWRLRM